MSIATKDGADILTADLMAALRERRHALTGEERTELLSLGLNLCQDCRAEITQYFPAQGFSFTEFVRRKLWAYLRAWQHGDGCPPES